MLERFLRRWFHHKDIGWEEIGERFTRYTLLRTPRFTVYLHQLDAPVAHAQCHDHPWDFVALLLWGGYWEYLHGRWTRRRPGEVLWRPAETSHNVVTRGVSWSVIVAGRKRRDWSLLSCDHDGPS